MSEAAEPAAEALDGRRQAAQTALGFRAAAGEVRRAGPSGVLHSL